MIYCFDTSAFIAAWVESYPPDVTPKLWSEHMPALIEARRLITPKDVLLELEKKAGKDDGLYEWVKKQDEAIVEQDADLLAESKRIINEYPRLIEMRRPGKGGADPIVIALASVRKATVVTKEGFSMSLKRPKIPDVCREEKISCIGMLDLIREEKWVFA